MVAPAACVLSEPVVHEGTEAALAAGAMVVRTARGLDFVTLDAEGRESGRRALDAERVPRRGLGRRRDGWVVAAQARGAPTLLLIDAAGAVTRRIALDARAAERPSELTEAAVATGGDRAWVPWRDSRGMLHLGHVDLLSGRAREVGEAVATHGIPLAAAATNEAAVSWTAPDAPLLTIRGDAVTRVPLPGPPQAVVGARRGALVIHTAPDRTGIWLSDADGAQHQILPGTEGASHISAAALPDGLLVAYVSGGDSWLLRVGDDGEPAGAPVILAPRALAPQVRVRDERVFIAYERETDAGPLLEIRTATCP